MAPSAVERYIKDYQDKVNRRDNDTLYGLASDYDRMAEDLAQQAKALLDEYNAALARGDYPGLALLSRMDRFAQFAQFIQEQALELEQTLGSHTTTYARDLATSYGDMISGLVDDAAQDTGTPFVRMMHAWNKDLIGATRSALEASSGNVGMARAIQGLTRRQALQARRAVQDGILQGKGYRDIKAAIRREFGMAHADAFRWIRTEGNRALRNAGKAATARLGVTRWRRTAARNRRTCIACLLADGKIYESEDRHDFHVNCRCALIPLLPETLSDGTKIDQSHNVQLESGRDWFDRQSHVMQEAILGRPAYKAWKAGDIDLDDLVHAHEHPTWGRSVKTAGLARAKAQAAARKARPKKAGAVPAAGPVKPPAANLTGDLLGAEQGLDAVFQKAGVPTASLPALRSAVANGTYQHTALLQQGADFSRVASLRPELDAALDVYRAAKDAYTDPKAAVGRGKDWARQNLGLDPDKASPKAVIQAMRRHLAGEKHQTPTMGWDPDSPKSAKDRAASQNAAGQWGSIKDQLPLKNPLMVRGMTRVKVKDDGRGRESADKDTANLYAKTNATTVAHELMHTLEGREGAIKDRHVRWLVDAAQRAGAANLTYLAKKYPKAGYRPDEVCWEIPGLDEYTTKVYSWPPGSDPKDPDTWYGSEMMSMWVNFVQSKRWTQSSAPDFKSDYEREWFYLILATLVGE